MVVLPGGFSYGDYLRAGAIARFSPIMKEVVAHARRGAPVLGICNGFQIACEAGLLPGRAAPKRIALQFVSAPVTMRVENTATMFTSRTSRGSSSRCRSRTATDGTPPIQRTLDRLEGEGRVVPLRRRGARATMRANPNGSTNATLPESSTTAAT